MGFWLIRRVWGERHQKCRSGEGKKEEHLVEKNSTLSHTGNSLLRVLFRISKQGGIYHQTDTGGLPGVGCVSWKGLGGVYCTKSGMKLIVREGKGCRPTRVVMKGVMGRNWGSGVRRKRRVIGFRSRCKYICAKYFQVR